MNSNADLTLRKGCEHMSHLPYGYAIENGAAVVDNEKADKIRRFLESYISGSTLSKAKADAGITDYHGSTMRLIFNEHYTGDEFYPAIVDKGLFEKASAEWHMRSERQGRLGYVKETEDASVPVNFHMRKAKKHFDNIKLQAEYLYSLIESEEK